jgi:hypothetical protein
LQPRIVMCRVIVQGRERLIRVHMDGFIEERGTRGRKVLRGVRGAERGCMNNRPFIKCC